MKITSIRGQVKNSERVSIFVDGKYSFSLSLNELVAEKLKHGEDLDASRLKKLQKLSADGKLRQRALEWSLNRPRSRREFHDYLRRKKIEPEHIEKLANEFTQKGYLDEASFSRWMVGLRVRGGKSNRAIAAELASKGIDRELANETIHSEAFSESERIKLVVEKKIKQSRYQKDPQKLMQYLARQGYSYDLIKQTLKPE